MRGNAGRDADVGESAVAVVAKDTLVVGDNARADIAGNPFMWEI
jgi:hypothetical protein